MTTQNQEDESEQKSTAYGADEDVQYENDSLGEEEKIEKLKKKLNDCLKERGDYLDGWQRAKADLVNARKSFDAERLRMLSYATESVILELIPVVDSFELALKHTETEEAVSKDWQEGVLNIYQQMLKILECHGVLPIDPAGGERFNMSEHAALQMQDTQNKEEDQKILAVVQRGYKMNDKVIRPAQVIIAHYQETSSM